jgi:hypothetical protein
MGNIEDGPSLDFRLVSTQYAKAAVQYALKMREITVIIWEVAWVRYPLIPN